MHKGTQIPPIVNDVVFVPHRSLEMPLNGEEETYTPPYSRNNMRLILHEPPTTITPSQPVAPIMTTGNA